MHIELTLNQLALMVSLGWEADEREVPQKVLLDVAIRFERLPKGCETDALKDTICYATLAKDLRQFAESQSFRLIEHLTHALYTHLKTQVGNRPIALTLTKFPPTKNLDHCTFTLRDE